MFSVLKLTFIPTIYTNERLTSHSHNLHIKNYTFITAAFNNQNIAFISHNLITNEFSENDCITLKLPLLSNINIHSHNLSHDINVQQLQFAHESTSIQPKICSNWKYNLFPTCFTWIHATFGKTDKLKIIFIPTIYTNKS